VKIDTNMTAAESPASRLELARDDLLNMAEELDKFVPEYNGLWDKARAVATRRVASHVSGVILVSVAWVEASVNEFLIDAADNVPHIKLTSAAKDCLRSLWHGWRAAHRGDPNLLEKTTQALKAIGIKHPQNELPSYKDFKVVVELRHALTHARPEFLSFGELTETERRTRLGDLQVQLQRRGFSPARGIPSSALYMWSQCLGYGCAVWATDVSRSFWNDWQTAITKVGSR
jgi:hypothetical protein